MPDADPRDRMAIALDVDDHVAAMRLARQVQPWFSVAKVGLELYSASGPDAVSALVGLGYDVFCDLKFHDIPTTVGRAARVVGALGARYLNFHAAGGVVMVRAGADGLRDGAASAGLPPPVPLAVTVLTSEETASPELLAVRVRLAVESGCEGVVCGPPDLPVVREIAPELLTVVPGIRPAGAEPDDQARTATPGDALAAGASLLVIGRPVNRADDPAAAAAAIAAEVLSAIAG